MSVMKSIRDQLIKIKILRDLGTMKNKLIDRLTSSEKIDIPSVSLDELKKIYETHNEDVCTADDKKYMIVTSNLAKGGLYVYLLDLLTKIGYAEQNGFIPVVDLLNVPSALRNNPDENAWELYFRQPGDVSVEDVYGASNIEFCHTAKNLLYIGDVTPDTNVENYQVVIDESKPYDVWLNDKKLMSMCRDCWSKYCRYSDNTSEYIEKKYTELIGDKKKVLGLLCRGTDYLSLKPYGHNMQPTIPQIIEKVGEVMAEYNCDHIYLATEDQDILDTLIKQYGEKLIFNDVPRVKYREGKLLYDLYVGQNNDIYQRQLNYLTDLEILSRLNYLIAGKTTGSRFIPIMKDRDFDYLYFWELGRYGM